MSQVLTATAHRAGERDAGETIDLKTQCDPWLTLRLVFRPQVGHWETAKATAERQRRRRRLSLHKASVHTGDPAERRREVQIGTHSSQSPPPANTNGCKSVLERQ